MTKTAPFDLGHYSSGQRRNAFLLKKRKSRHVFFAAGQYFCYSMLAFIRKKPVT